MLGIVRRHAATIVVAMVVAAVTAGGPALAGLATHAAPAAVGTPPAVTTGFKAGPVDLPETTGNIASLGVSQGKYLITASFLLTNGAPGLYSFCQLKAGKDVQKADEGTTSGETYDFVTVHVIHTFSSAGSIRLQCNDASASSNIDARFIRITAVSVNRITRVGLG